MDLTKIEKPFGLLDKETQDALQAHGGPYEFFGPGGWEDVCPAWINYLVYRAKPMPLTKPSIDWSHVAPEYRYLVTDEGGSSWLYANKPSVVIDLWSVAVCGNVVYAHSFASLRPGTCDWRDSLVKRPDEGDK